MSAKQTKQVHSILIQNKVRILTSGKLECDGCYTTYMVDSEVDDKFTISKTVAEDAYKQGWRIGTSKTLGISDALFCPSCYPNRNDPYYF